ncbi:GSCOCG00010210001-RA-CDS [Cotesia congregata]|uniref:Uncharacterized protein n=1 Tax=Cotesia congregata TaxID=51543 RepID=A0A8J2HAT3_COTCN|nr:GSCOCG00010210001-RA-CDS [Cotesia congregata]CAG5085288.1 Protein of unknown function [Cotesia congregata]
MKNRSVKSRGGRRASTRPRWRVARSLPPTPRPQHATDTCHQLRGQVGQFYRVWMQIWISHSRPTTEQTRELTCRQSASCSDQPIHWQPLPNKVPQVPLEHLF